MVYASTKKHLFKIRKISLFQIFKCHEAFRFNCFNMTIFIWIKTSLDKVGIFKDKTDHGTATLHRGFEPRPWLGFYYLEVSELVLESTVSFPGHHPDMAPLVPESLGSRAPHVLAYAGSAKEKENIISIILREHAIFLCCPLPPFPPTLRKRDAANLCLPWVLDNSERLLYITQCH